MAALFLFGIVLKNASDIEIGLYRSYGGKNFLARYSLDMVIYTYQK